MSDEKWVVTCALEGGLFINEDGKFLPATKGRKAITNYAILEQNLLKKPSRFLHVGLNIPADVDQVCVAFQEMEAFLMALSIELNVSITGYEFHMTAKPEEWPKDIEFKKANGFEVCKEDWEPVQNFEDPKNRIRLDGFSGFHLTSDLRPSLDEKHKLFTKIDDYQTKLIKDYIAGLDTEYKQPSLAMLYFFKVLERVGKKEYGANQHRSLSTGTLTSMIGDLDDTFTPKEMELAESACRWRHKQSEAHLVTEGVPSKESLRVCKKMAQYFMKRAL